MVPNIQLAHFADKCLICTEVLTNLVLFLSKYKQTSGRNDLSLKIWLQQKQQQQKSLFHMHNYKTREKENEGTEHEINEQTFSG